MSKEKVIVLSDKDQARKRINVFHGSANNWINMIKELSGNSLDVFPKEETHEIIIKIIDTDEIYYKDDGCGIPVEGIASNGMPNYQAIFEKPFAGTKYDQLSKTVGQNGIFLYSLSATCEDITYHIARPDGNVYEVKYHEGDRVEDMKIIDTSKKTFSEIHFKLDSKVWNNINFTYKEISEIVKGQSALANVIIKVEDVKTNRHCEFRYENGILDYYRELTSEKYIVTDDIRITTSKKVKTDRYNQDGTMDEVDVDMILSYSTDIKEDVEIEFLNTAWLVLHGTIQEGILLGIKKSVDEWLKNNGKYNKNEKAISKDDVQTGLNYVCKVDSFLVEYDNQVKQRTSAKHYREALRDIIYEFFQLYQLENKIAFEKLCNQVLINKRAKEKSDKARQEAKKKLTEKITITSKVQGLIDCKSEDVSKRRILVCEGKSALSGLIDGRTDYQALFPLRGKVLNCFKASDDQIFKNDVILNLYRALGCGVEYSGKGAKKTLGGEFSLDNLRYQGIDIVVDADPDGVGSICPLILTMIYKLTPTLIKEGRIRLILTPLYEVICGSDDYYYASDDEELAEIENKLKGKKYSIHYVKGIGELSNSTMEYCLSDEYKRVYTFTMEDFNNSLEKLEIFMGEDIEKRKEYILKEY